MNDAFSSEPLGPFRQLVIDGMSRSLRPTRA